MNNQSESTRADVSAANPRGVGLRLSVHPHCDDFVAVILAALDRVDTHGLVIETDELGTYVTTTWEPAEQRITEFARDLIRAAVSECGGGHVVAHILLSRGCPGAMTAEQGPEGVLEVAPIRLEPTGIPAAAQWSLYPLSTRSGGAEHMTHIDSAIDVARSHGTLAHSLEYASKLTGDVSDVLSTAVDGWMQIGTQVTHVVSHLTVSVNSPSSEPNVSKEGR